MERGGDDGWSRREVLKSGAALGGAALAGGGSAAGAGSDDGDGGRTAWNPRPAEPEEVAPGLYRFPDSCSVYVLRKGSRGLAIDFGSGAFLEHLPEIGVQELDAVLLTHPHSDQCRGLARRDDWPFEIHAPSGASEFLSPGGVRSFWKNTGGAGVPPNYLPLDRPISGVKGDLSESGSGHYMWNGLRIRPVETPGHTDAALTYVVDWRGRRLAFCGDALSGPGSVWQPYHLEWNHWTAKGARRARKGLSRLSNVALDLLLPSHGASMREPDHALRQTIGTLGDFIDAKDCICPGVEEKWLSAEEVTPGVRRVLPHLYRFGMNGYILVSRSGEALLLDPPPDAPEKLRNVADELDIDGFAAATATHYHSDHVNGLPPARDELGADVWLHPHVARVATEPDAWRRPWLPERIEDPDRILPKMGVLEWHEYGIRVFPLPGQTRYHCGLLVGVNGTDVLFSGDNFHPPSLWGGSGGFCAFNEGYPSMYGESAGKVLELAPDVICAGHGSYYEFLPEHMRAVQKWAERARASLTELAPGRATMAQYNCHAFDIRPYRAQAAPGEMVELTLHVRNHRGDRQTLTIRPDLPAGWEARRELRRVTVGAGKNTGVPLELRVPSGQAPGRQVVGVSALRSGRRLGQVARAAVDVTA